ncbi:hypothetical protein ACP3UH_31175, partial [Klebsiella pneumoniae]
FGIHCSVCDRWIALLFAVQLFGVRCTVSVDGLFGVHCSLFTLLTVSVCDRRIALSFGVHRSLFAVRVQ